MEIIIVYWLFCTAYMCGYVLAAESDWARRVMYMLLMMIIGIVMLPLALGNRFAKQLKK